MKRDLISQITFVFESCLMGLLTKVFRFRCGEGGFLVGGQHHPAKIRKLRLPRSRDLDVCLSTK